jgi:hypothetical protein
MQVYHRTAVAAVILADGFQDSAGTYMTPEVFTGIWLSDVPLRLQAGAKGHAVVTLDIPGALFTAYEWVDDAKSYREALVPAAVLNQYGPPRVLPREAEGAHLMAPYGQNNHAASRL